MRIIRGEAGCGRLAVVHAIIGAVVVAGRSGQAWTAGDADIAADIGEGVGRNVGDDTVVAANALANFGAHPQPVRRINLRKAADFTAELDRIEAPQVAGRAGVALEDQLADETGAETSLVDQRIGHVVVARGEADRAAGLAERDQGRDLEHALRGAFILRAEEAGGTDLQIPVTGPEILAVTGRGGVGRQQKGSRKEDERTDTQETTPEESFAGAKFDRAVAPREGGGQERHEGGLLRLVPTIPLTRSIQPSFAIPGWRTPVTGQDRS